MNSIIVGLDEAGRGPLAGPVSAGCVILPPDFPMDLLNDSKKMTEKKREKAYQVIKERAFWGVGLVDHTEIDRINILQASLKAMKIAYDMMLLKYGDKIDPETLEAIADGTFIPDVSCPCRAEPKADGKYPAVMAASIIAKVTRDHIMVEYDRQYPEYGYAGHKGYPTPAHKEICRKLGASPIQRLSFKY